MSRVGKVGVWRLSPRSVVPNDKQVDRQKDDKSAAANQDDERLGGHTAF